MLVTDDIELKATGHVSVCIMARKYTGRHLFRSRGGIKGHFAYRTSHAAGFIVGAATTTPLEQDTYVTLDGIEIEFESRRGSSAQITPCRLHSGSCSFSPGAKLLFFRAHLSPS